MLVIFFWVFKLVQIYHVAWVASATQYQALTLIKYS